jgi:hypothetical protein
LNARALRFSDWLCSTRQAFRIRRTADPLRQLALLKPLAEYALCHELLLSYGSQDQRLTENFLWAWDELEQGELIRRLVLARPDAFCAASAYAPFRRYGYRNHRLDSVLQEVSQLVGTRVAEMQAWLRLGFLHAMAGIEGSRYDPQESGPTWLLAMPEPWIVNDDIVYSVTHEVFYSSDFGRATCQFPDEIIAYLELWLPVWTRCYIAQENWDLTAELVMVADCLPTFVWDKDPLPLLLARQNSKGEVPGPVGAGSSFIDDTQTAEEAAFWGCYHTTLVSAMAVGLRDYQHSTKR